MCFHHHDPTPKYHCSVQVCSNTIQYKNMKKCIHNVPKNLPLFTLPSTHDSPERQWHVSRGSLHCSCNRSLLSTVTPTPSISDMAKFSLMLLKKRLLFFIAETFPKIHLFRSLFFINTTTSTSLAQYSWDVDQTVQNITAKGERKQ